MKLLYVDWADTGFDWCAVAQAWIGYIDRECDKHWQVHAARLGALPPSYFAEAGLALVRVPRVAYLGAYWGDA